MATFLNFSNLQNKKRLSAFFCSLVFVSFAPVSAQAQNNARSSTYEPPKMFGAPPAVQPGQNNHVLRQGTSSTAEQGGTYVPPLVGGVVSTPDDAELDKNYKPYIPNFAPPPVMPEPIEQSPAALGVEVESVITPPVPAKKPAVPVMAEKPTLTEDVKQDTQIAAPEVMPVVEPKVVAPASPAVTTAKTPEPPLAAPALPEEPKVPQKPSGVVKGPKTMPAAPATQVTAEKQAGESALQDGALMERHLQEQQELQEQTAAPAGSIAMPKSFKADGEKNTNQKLMIFKPGETDLPATDVNFLQKELAPFLKASPAAQLDVVGYASLTEGEPNSDKRAALSRVMAVRSVLINEGVSPEQLNLRAMGSKTDKEPVDRIDLFLK